MRSPSFYQFILKLVCIKSVEESRLHMYTCTSLTDDEYPPPSLLPYVKRRTSSILDKWSRLERFLREREQQLEMSSGSMQDYLENLKNLLNWIDGELRRESLEATPSAHAPLLKGYLTQIQVSILGYLKRNSCGS